MRYLTTPVIQKIFTIFPSARLVGGCVRDFYLGKSTQDFDFTLPHPPLFIIDRLKEHDISYNDQSVQYGAIHLFSEDGNTYEITSLRKDINPSGRSTQVSFDATWEEDAARRDFTINAIYLDQHGNIFDPYNGLNDLKYGIIRFIGDPHRRICEDYLRLWRYYRFWSEYSLEGSPQRFKLELYKDGVSQLSLERVRSELFKILVSLRALEVCPFIRPLLQVHFATLCNTPLSDQFLGSLLFGNPWCSCIPYTFRSSDPRAPAQQMICKRYTFLFSQVIQNESYFSLPFSPLRRLYSLFQENRKVEDELIRSFPLQRQEKQWMKKIEMILTHTDPLYTNPYFVWHFFGESLFWDWLVISAPLKERYEVKFWKNWGKIQAHAPFPLRPLDVYHVTHCSPHEISSVWKTVLVWWCEKKGHPNKQECLDFLKNSFIPD